MVNEFFSFLQIGFVCFIEQRSRNLIDPDAGIGDEEAQFIANALIINKVKMRFFDNFIFDILLNRH